MLIIIPITTNRIDIFNREIPSILVETAFISNIEEEKKLKTAKFQQQIAESIFKGIKAYFANGGELTLADRS